MEDFGIINEKMIPRVINNINNNNNNNKEYKETIVHLTSYVPFWQRMNT
jgi:hypothetical protein